MDDTTTLRKDEVPLSSISHRHYCRGYPGVSVSIKAEQGQSQSDETQSPLEPNSPIHGGIKATTVVTQEVQYDLILVYSRHKVIFIVPIRTDNTRIAISSTPQIQRSSYPT
ncbi:Ornithine carbamoyltransferase [Fusarium oxysporum f. sp. albedinis]|nr:Ornithine carbamoyltransferase [Fusarium oxysporum f. sp. albedinis]